MVNLLFFLFLFFGGNLLKLESNDFKHEELIPGELTCDGANVSPELHWGEAPKETKSFALTVRDPDAPMGTFDHWFVYDIPATVNRIEKDSLPERAKQLQNDFGKEDYGGPCPPSGVHRYYFTLYALNVENLAEFGSKQEFLKKLEEHAIERAELMGKYQRQ